MFDYSHLYLEENESEYCFRLDDLRGVIQYKYYQIRVFFEFFIHSSSLVQRLQRS